MQETANSIVHRKWLNCKCSDFAVHLQKEFNVKCSKQYS
jgi:hypothetical protein